MIAFKITLLDFQNSIWHLVLLSVIFSTHMTQFWTKKNAQKLLFENSPLPISFFHSAGKQSLYLFSTIPFTLVKIVSSQWYQATEWHCRVLGLVNGMRLFPSNHGGKVHLWTSLNMSVTKCKGYPSGRTSGQIDGARGISNNPNWLMSVLVSSCSILL